MTEFDFSEYTALKDNWDGQGALAPSEKTITYFKRIAEPLAWPEHIIYVSNVGTADIEDAPEFIDHWESTGGFHLSVDESSWSMYVKVVDDETYYFRGTSHATFPYRTVQKSLDLYKQRLEQVRNA